jgi:hypothetical protein
MQLEFARRLVDLTDIRVNTVHSILTVQAFKVV